MASDLHWKQPSRDEKNTVAAVECCKKWLLHHIIEHVIWVRWGWKKTKFNIFKFIFFKLADVRQLVALTWSIFTDVEFEKTYNWRGQCKWWQENLHTLSILSSSLIRILQWIQQCTHLNNFATIHHNYSVCDLYCREPKKTKLQN